MLDSRGIDTRGMETNFYQSDKGFYITDPRPADHAQVMHKKTVKELLMMRRKVLQKLNSQDDKNMVHKFKSVKSEAPASGLSPHHVGPPGPGATSVVSLFAPASPENGYMTPRQTPHPALPQEVAPGAEVTMTLFHWQIQREAQKVGGVPTELLNLQDSDGDTCLHVAVAQGKRALAYVLATKMAPCGSLDTKEHNGQTALQLAVTTNQHHIVRDLLAHGAQVNTRDLWGRSPLHVCAEKGYFLTLQSIWRSGQPIDVEMFNYEGITPLHAAVLHHNAVVKEQRSLENICSYMTKELLQRTRMYAECVKTLLLMGASCGTKDRKSGRTCLHMASEEANVELLNIFLDQPSSLSLVNVKTFSGNTALHVVVSLQNHRTQVEAVKLLMRKGADPGTKNFENELPSQLVPEGPTGEKVRQVLKGKSFHV